MLWEFHRARLRDGSAVAWEPEEGGAVGWGREGRPQPHHQHPLCGRPVPPASSRDWKPCLSLATEPSFPSFMEKHICIASFVVEDVKCFQSWEYALSSADISRRNGTRVKVLVGHELCVSQLAAVWLFRSICFILLSYIFTSVHYHDIFTSVAPSSDLLCRDHAGRCACWSEETAQQWGSTNAWPRALVTNNFYSPCVWRNR